MKKYLFLFLIFLLGTILRFYSLGNVPVSLHRDEAFLGYNAYSILKTGRDISGHFMPIHLESFYFSPDGYAYLSIPFIVLFGLNSFSVRFAAALFGSLTIILIFWFSQKLFEKHKEKNLIALFCALIFAVNPWSINLSRTATENVIVVFFITLAILIYLKYIKSRSLIPLIFSLFSFWITFFIYQASRAFLPVFLPFLFLINNFKSLRKHITFHSFLFVFLIILPIFSILSSPNLSLRIKDLSIFNQPQVPLVIREQTYIDAVTGLPYIATRIFHNKVVNYSFVFLNNYFGHFSFGFLFSDQGFPDRYRIPQVGLFYIFELPLLLFALFALFKKDLKNGLFLSGWILISFMGSALTFDDIPNMQRTLIAVPAFSILSGYGFYSILKLSEKFKKIGKLFIAFFILIIGFNIAFYLVQYYFEGKVYRPWYRQDGYQTLVDRVNGLLPKYKQAVITDRETASTIFFLLYSNYNPKKFQDETKKVNMRQSDHVGFGKYMFSDEECPLRIDEKTNKLTGKAGILYVNSGLCKDKVPPGTKLLGEVRRVDDSRVFYILEVIAKKT